jgi:hypothetical protein
VIVTPTHSTSPFPLAQPTNLNPGDPIPLINGRRPINSGNYAGSNYQSSNLPSGIQSTYPSGVDFTAAGFPDFTPDALHNVYWIADSFTDFIAGITKF